MLKSPLSKRPLSFYGPDDWDGYTEWQKTEADIKLTQAAWDNQYLSLSKFDRFKVWLHGNITEPVGTSAGLALTYSPGGEIGRRICFRGRRRKV